jgi:hypothetical protein
VQVAGENFATMIRGGQHCSILREYHVSPWTQSILQENVIDGLMLDTTWHVIRQSVTTIVMAVYCHVGVPLEFALGVAETMELDQQHYDAFTELFAIDLSRYILESDQGSELSAICTRHDQIQLICLRYFLLSLKLKEFGLAVGNLVKFRTQDEFESLTRVYEIEFRKVRDQKRLDLLARNLKRAGLVFITDEIVIEDEWAVQHCVNVEACANSNAKHYEFFGSDQRTSQ